MVDGEPMTEVMQRCDGFSRWLGVVYRELAESSAVLELQIRAEMLNGFGIVHGGILFSLADSAMAFAANSGSEVSVAINGSVDFLLPAHEGDKITATARQLGSGKRVRHFEVRITNQRQEHVAQFRGAVYNTKKTAADVGAEVHRK